MRKLMMFLMIAALSACTVFKAGDISKERKELYDYNNDKAFCKQNPDKCVDNIPWM